MSRDYWFCERREGDPDIRPLTMRAVMNLDVVCLKENGLAVDAMRVMRGENPAPYPGACRAWRGAGGAGHGNGCFAQCAPRKKANPRRALSRHPGCDVGAQAHHDQEVQTLSPDARVEKCAAMLLDNKNRCLPIVDEQEGVVGIVTETDMMKLLKHVVEN